MKKFNVTITETLTKTVEVEAESIDETEHEVNLTFTVKQVKNNGGN